MRGLRARQLALGLTAGLLAGLVHAVLLAVLNGSTALANLGGVDRPDSALVIHLTLSALMGIAYAWLFRPVPGYRAETLMSGLAYGLLAWVLLSLNLIPILSGKGPQWQIEAVTPALPFLIGYLLQGAMVSLGYHILSDEAARRWGPVGEPADVEERPIAPEHRIVILGGGYAGVTTTQHLERLFARDDSVAITLVSNTNHFLFTPMLSEVTASGVDAQHISAPLRAFFARTQVIRGEAETVDFEERVVRLDASGTSARRDIPFDYLVLAVGAVPNFFGLHSVQARALTFKSLEDATLLRNHVIEMLERADAEPNPERRKALLTIVVAGGGFAGAELIGGLNDFTRGSLWYYPNTAPEDVSLILVHSGERILPELSPESAEYAREKLETRGITFKLETRVVDADLDTVVLDDGETITAETLVWTAGNRPHPLIRSLGLDINARGAARTDATMAVLGQSNVWALGDCAAVPDGRTGEIAPPTAQHAQRQAVTLAGNIYAAIRGKRPKPFSHRSIGTLAVLGHQTAVAEIRGRQFSGLFAWLMWRAIYLAKLPTLEKKVRVALDWTVDLFFPRDIVQTMTFPNRLRKSSEPMIST